MALPGVKMIQDMYRDINTLCMNENVVDFKLKDGVETTIRSLRGFFGAATQRKKKYMFFFFCNARTVVKHQS